MRHTAPVLSPLTPLQLILLSARTVGLGRRTMWFLLRRLASKHSRHKVFEGYEPDEHDIFITCFSKSGTNWAMQLVTQTTHRGAGEFSHIHDLVAWPEGKFPGIVRLGDPGPRQRCPTGRRAIKTALDVGCVPVREHARYLTIARDPKDVVVSAYHFITGVFGMSRHITLEQWLQNALAPDSLFMEWPNHMAGWWALRDTPHVEVFFYSEMKRDLAAHVDRLQGLLGIELSEAERAEVIRRAGFEYMHANEACFAPIRMPLLTGRRSARMIRTGKVGGSRAALPAGGRSASTP